MPMKVDFLPEDKVWRKAGRPPRSVPDEVVDMAERVYNSGTCGVISLTGGTWTPQAVRELLKLLRAHAKATGRALVHQQDAEQVRFKLQDKIPTARRAA